MESGPHSNMHQTSPLRAMGRYTNTAFREMVSLEAGSGQNRGFQDEPWLRFGEESRPKREELES